MSSPTDKGNFPPHSITRNRTWVEHDVDVTGPDEIELKINRRAEGFHTTPEVFYLTLDQADDLATSLAFAVQDAKCPDDPDAGLGDEEAEAMYREQVQAYNAGIADGLRRVE